MTYQIAGRSRLTLSPVFEMNQRKVKAAVSAVLTVKLSRLAIFQNYTPDKCLGLFFIKLSKLLTLILFLI